VVKSGLVAALLLIGCSSSGQLESVQTQLEDLQAQVVELSGRTPTRGEVSDLETRLSGESERQIRSEADILTEIRGLGEKLVELEAQLRDSSYQIARLSDQVEETRVEIKALAAVRPASTEGRPIDISDHETLYQTAYGDFKRDKYRLAILGFREYMDAFPTSELADNALYWTGESYYAQRLFSQAIDTFSDFLVRYPVSEKVASALLRSALSHLERGDREDGVRQLRELVKELPSSAEAGVARQQLAELEVRD